MKNMYKQPFVGILNITTTSALCASGRPSSPVNFKGGQANNDYQVL